MRERSEGGRERERALKVSYMVIIMKKHLNRNYCISV
jgi:hypothetical protein